MTLSTQQDMVLEKGAGASRFSTAMSDLFWIAILLCMTRVTLLPDLNTFGAAALDVVSLVVISRSPAVYLDLMRRNLLLLSWPALALLSSMWSILPGVTLYHAVQFALTCVAGLVLYQVGGLERLLRIV